ncbi:MAG: hypothetical protein LBI59_09935, partial [Candidatus Accumulibacter sp.]|nr:hypothetical protein [Accumulibacter sp.]
RYRHCEGRRHAAIQRASQVASAFRKTEPPHGLPRRAARAMTGRGDCHVASLFVMTISASAKRIVHAIAIRVYFG